MKKRILFIVNPKSGTTKKENMEFSIARWVDKQQFEPDVYYTQYAGHATEIAFQNRHRFEVIVAVGGDGTVNEVAKGLTGSDTALYIVPTGSGNGLARHLGIPMGIIPSLRRLNQAEELVIDSCKVNDTPFFCTSGMGYDALVAHEFSLQKTRGLWTYMMTSFKCFFTYKPEWYELEIDGKKQERQSHLITLANAGQYGNNAYIAPQAEINDGRFDVCIVNPIRSPLQGMFFSLRLFTYSLHRSRKVEIIRAENVKIRRKAANWLHVDGEPVGMPADLDYQIFPKNLKVLR
ncbi:MAG: diacylglycerol/lipid kinase family protein [Thermoflexibacteraceae bacterium]|jgi:diacylglycerol kinase (ATP)